MRKLIYLFGVLIILVSCNKNNEPNATGKIVIKNVVNAPSTSEVDRVSLRSVEDQELASAAWNGSSATIDVSKVVPGQSTLYLASKLPAATVSNPNARILPAIVGAKKGQSRLDGLFTYKDAGEGVLMFFYADSDVDITGASFDMKLKKGWNMVFVSSSMYTTTAPANWEWQYDPTGWL